MCITPVPDLCGQVYCIPIVANIIRRFTPESLIDDDTLLCPIRYQNEENELFLPISYIVQSYLNDYNTNNRG